MGREALPGSPSGNRQIVQEATGGEDGGRQGRLGNLAMEAKLVSAPFSRLRSRRVRRHPIALAARLAARLALAAARLAASRAAASATKAALKHELIAAPQRHQVGTTSGRMRWGQPSNPNDQKGRQEWSETGWCYLRQGSRNRWAKVSTSPN
jgi:hypothetical protein